LYSVKKGLETFPIAQITGTTFGRFQTTKNTQKLANHNAGGRARTCILRIIVKKNYQTEISK